MSLAYFIAEEFYHSPAARFRVKTYKRAKKLLCEAKSSFTRDLRAQFDDTCGAVAITFGQKEPEIRRGLHLCHQALVAAKGTPTAKPPKLSTDCMSTEPATNSSRGSNYHRTGRLIVLSSHN
jgi:hypothetical protein